MQFELVGKKSRMINVLRFLTSAFVIVPALTEYTFPGEHC